MTQRRSDKHNPRVDECLDEATSDLTHGSPVSSRSRPDLRQEDPAEEAPASAGPAPATPPGMAAQDVELRSLLARSLRPGVFPADRDRLVAVARQEEASDLIVAALRSLPGDRRFAVVEEVAEELGDRGENRTRHF